jgi:capsular polysaccharide biosynthesis protein
MALAYRADDPPERSPREWRSLVWRAARADPQGALDACEAAVRAWPLKAELLDLKGEILVRLHRAAEAEAALGEALAIDPAHEKATLRLARLRIGQGRPSEAIRVMEAGLAAGGKRKAIVREGCQLLLEIGEFDRAATWIARVIAWGKHPAAEMLEFHRQAIRGLSDDAAQGVCPERKRTQRQAMEALAQGDPETAARAFAKLTRACPAYIPAWLGWRGALEASGRTQALADLRRAWTVFSPRTKPLIDGLMHRRLGRRGLVFDPREPLAVRPDSDSLEPVASLAGATGRRDAVLTLDEGGRPFVVDQVLDLGGGAPERTRFEHRTAPKRLIAVETATLVGRGVALNRDGELIQALAPPGDLAKAGLTQTADGLRFDAEAFQDGLCPLRVFDTPALLLAGPTDNSFGDFMLNFPPRLAIAEAAGLDLPVVVRRGLPQPWLDLLEALGVRRDRILFHDPAGVSLFPRLYVPSWPLPRRWEPMADLLGVYRQRLARPAAGPRERLYLSRERIEGRRLANEAEARALFERHGFRTVHPEQLRFDEVRDLFGRASCIAGPYGSAFLNVVHAASPPKALVLMPRGAEAFLDEVALWLGAAGAPFGYLRGAPAVRRAGWTVPLDRLEAAVADLVARA